MEIENDERKAIAMEIKKAMTMLECGMPMGARNILRDLLKRLLS